MNLYDKVPKNASRKLHARFRALNLSLPVRITAREHATPDGEPFWTHWVKPSDWLQVLLKKFPKCVLGNCVDATLQLTAFWNLYRQSHESHDVFTQRGNDLGRTIPLAVFGDEGRGSKRGNFLVWSMESLIGLDDLPADFTCDCCEKLRASPVSGVGRCAAEKRDVPADLLDRAKRQMTNYSGHSYLTRHFLFGLPHWLYKAEGREDVVNKHLDALTVDLRNLFTRGVQVGNETYFAALVAGRRQGGHEAHGEHGHRAVLPQSQCWNDVQLVSRRCAQRTF